MSQPRSRADWKAMVYRFPADGRRSNGMRVLLLLLSDQMDAYRKVSVPQRDLAAALGVSVATVRNRVAAAHEFGYLTTVEAGRPGRTAVYQGLFPDVEVMHPLGVHKPVAQLVQGRVHKQTPPLVHPQGLPASSKRSESGASTRKSHGTQEEQFVVDDFAASGAGRGPAGVRERTEPTPLSDALKKFRSYASGV